MFTRMHHGSQRKVMVMDKEWIISEKDQRRIWETLDQLMEVMKGKYPEHFSKAVSDLMMGYGIAEEKISEQAAMIKDLVEEPRECPICHHKILSPLDLTNSPQATGEAKTSPCICGSCKHFDGCGLRLDSIGVVTECTQYTTTKESTDKMTIEQRDDVLERLKKRHEEIQGMIEDGTLTFGDTSSEESSEEYPRRRPITDMDFFCNTPMKGCDKECHQCTWLRALPKAPEESTDTGEGSCPKCGGGVGHKVNCPDGIAFSKSMPGYNPTEDMDAEDRGPPDDVVDGG